MLDDDDDVLPEILKATLSFCVSRTCVTRVDWLRRIVILCPSGVTRACVTRVDCLRGIVLLCPKKCFPDLCWPELDYELHSLAGADLISLDDVTTMDYHNYIFDIYRLRMKCNILY